MIELDKVSYTYNDETIPCLKDISIKANNGEITLCTGVSGCGKSTLIRLINSLCPNYYGGLIEGDICIDGASILGEELSVTSAKVGTLFQDPERQFFALNVEDEIAFALEWQGIDKDEITKRVNSVITQFSLDSIRHQSISELSEGQKQKVGLASVVAMQIKNIILDEPTANLDPESTLELAQILNVLKEQGFCIFVVDHRLYYLKDIADVVYVLDKGQLVANGDFSIIENESFCKTYGLRKANLVDKRDSLKSHLCNDEIIVDIENLSFTYKNRKEIFKDLSLSIGPGIHILLGNNGVGKTTLSRLIFKLEKANSGTITFSDEKTTAHPLSKGSIVLQNTDYQLNMTSVYKELKSCFDFSLTKSTDTDILDLLEKLGLSKFKDRHPQSLSGGQKQRLVIGCALAKSPNLIVLDEPTSGLDGLNMLKIKNLLKDYSDKGNSVIIITHDLELIDEDYFDVIRL